MRIKRGFPSLVLVAMAFAGTAAASNGTARLVIHRGGQNCATQDLAELGKTSLCVKGGNFSHDVYQLKISRKIALTGIDDETTKGLEADWNGRRLRLACEPKLEPSDIVSGGMKELLLKQGKSEDEAEAIAQAIGMVETGRACTLTVNESPVWQVEVVFP